MKLMKFGKQLLKQIIAAREFLDFKSPKTPKKPKSEKIPYRPGTLGLSAVSQAILKDYGMILSRRERKELAKQKCIPFKAYYNF